MEDLKKRLQFKNSSLQIQTVWRIYEEIIKKTSDGVPITQGSPEIPELTTLLDGLCDQDRHLAQLCGDALLQLVISSRVLHMGRALDLLLAAVPSVRSLSPTVSVIHQLLITEAMAISTTEGNYTCPYGVRSKVHPMITVLSHRPEAWYCLSEELAGTITHPDLRVRRLAVEVSRPVLTFLLAHPSTTGQVGVSRLGEARIGLLHAVMTQLRGFRRRQEHLAKSGGSTRGDWCVEEEKVLTDITLDIVELLLQTLPMTPISSENQVIFVLAILEYACDALIYQLERIPAASSHGDLQCRIVGLQSMAFTFGMEIIVEAVKKDIGVAALASKMSLLAQKGGAIALQNADIILLLAGELLNCPFIQEKVLTLVKDILGGCPSTANVLCMASLVKPLLQIIASPAGIAAGLGRRCAQVVAGEILLLVQERVHKTSFKLETVSPLPQSFLTAVGHKCRVVRDLLLSLTNNTIPRSKNINGQHVEASQIGVDALIAAWATNARVALEDTQGKRSVRSHQHGKDHVLSTRLPRLAAAALIVAPNAVASRAVCDLVQIIARMEPAQALDFLPVILYCLRKTLDPETRLSLLQTLPHLATHKYCVPPVLKLVSALSQTSSTRAVAVRLMTQLWAQQDRVFPQLLQLFAERGPQGSDRESSDVLLAKATAILEICKLKPDKHGAELLAPLSHILEVSGGPQHTAVSVLLVESLYLLCKAEVMDLLSLWNVLGLRLECEYEQRPLVGARVCKLLSLVPAIGLDTEEYKTFTSDVVKNLWSYTQSDSSVVRRAAYEALACFTSDHFLPSHLPQIVTTDLQQQVDEAERECLLTKGDKNAEEQEGEITIDQMFLQVPSHCYTSLLKCHTLTDKETLEGWRVFMKAMVKKEVADIPRGVYFSSANSGRKHTGRQFAAVDNIPASLQQQYDKCKKSAPSRSALAAGLLLCYNPPVETGRDGRQFIVRHSSRFLQTFNDLLQEVPTDTSQWYFCSLLPTGWKTFMQRLFIAVLEGRRAQLDFQEKQGNLTSSETAHEMAVAWLWARDSIVDVIRATSRTSPRSQANSVMSLAALALCMHRHASSVDPAALEIAESDEVSSRLVSHSRWLSMACDTVMSLISVDNKPMVGLLGLCHQKSTMDRAKPSAECSAAAQASCSLLVPVLMAFPTGGVFSGSVIIFKLLTDFSGAVKGENGASLSKLTLWDGLSLGMLLASLFEEHFSDTTGSKGMLAVWKGLTALEKASLSLPTPGQQTDATVAGKTGCVVGLGLALCGLCAEGKTESRVHVTATLDKMLKVLSETPADDPVYEILCLSVSRLAASVQACNASPEDVTSKLVESLTQVLGQHPHLLGVSMSLGLLLSTSSKLGSWESSHLMAETAKVWLKGLDTEDTYPKTKTSKLAGLMAMVGTEQTFIKGSSTSSDKSVSLSEIISSTTKILTGSSNDLELKGSCAWMLGHLHSALSSDPGCRSSVPSSYSYLPESSFLRAVVDLLLEAGRSSGYTTSQVSAALQILKTKLALPPLDWAGLLSPFMRLNNGETVQTSTLEVAINQMLKSSSASTFISSWITPPLFNSLPLNTQCALHRSMPLLIKSMSPGLLRIYLEHSCHQTFTDLAYSHSTSGPLVAGLDSTSPPGTAYQGSQEDGHVVAMTAHDAAMNVLEGLRDALSVENPPQSVTMLLYEAVGRFYALLPVTTIERVSEQCVDLLKVIGECLVQVPDDILDSILSADFADPSSQLKGSFVRCHLVACGRQPVALLNVVIDAAFNLEDWKQGLGLSILAHCLSTVPDDKSSPTSQQEDTARSRIQWLSELLGHTGSIAAGVWPLADCAPAVDQVIQYMTDVVACVSLTYTFPSAEDLALYGLNTSLFKYLPNKRSFSTTDVAETSKGRQQDKLCLPPWVENIMRIMADYFPSVIQSTAAGPFAVLVPKVLDWLLKLVSLAKTKVETKIILAATLRSLRHMQEFKQATLWTRVLEL